MSGSRGGKLRSGSGAVGARPFGYFMEYDTAENAESTARAVAALRCVVDAVVAPPHPRTGVVTYCFAQRRGGDKRLRFFEIFADSQAWAEAVPEPAVDSALLLYTDRTVVAALLAGAINLDPDDDATVVGTSSVCPSRGVQVLAGSLLVPEAISREPRPAPNEGFVLELRAEPRIADGASTSLLDAMKAVAEPAARSGDAVSAFVTGPWWRQRRARPALSRKETVQKEEAPIRDVEPNGAFSEAALTLTIVVSNAARAVDAPWLGDGQLTALAAAASHLETVLVVESAGWQSVSVLEARIAAKLGCPAERFEVCAGYTLHPSFCATAPSPTSPTPPPPPPPPPQSPKAEVSALQQRHSSSLELFQVRRHAISGAAEAFMFTTMQKAGKNAVPLLAIVRSVCNISPRDTEIPAGVLFGQLARLRSLQSDSVALANSLDSGVDIAETNPALADRLLRFLEMLSGLGYPLGEKSKVDFPGLKELIAALEHEFSAVVEGGRAAADAFSRGGGVVPSPVEYMALQELYHIGGLVKSSSVGALSGAVVGLRVADAYYQPARSLFGTRKFGFRLRLETLVALGGGEFLTVTWEEAIEEFVGTRDVSSLCFVPITSLASISPPELLSRAQALMALGSDAAHFHHRAGCFFPHGRQSFGSGASSGSRGGASSAQRRASPGSVVLDPRRGLELGHAPAFAVDEAGIAIAGAFRAFRGAQQAASENETEAAKAERLRAAGLRLHTFRGHSIPTEIAVTIWPTVACFSLTTKVWGHVLVDGIEPVGRSRVPWDALVLPPETKEVLLATAASALRSGALGKGLSGGGDTEACEELHVEPRYAYRDIIDSKGTGMLFLLLGPPGVGKTLSVEALAAYFGRPLYAISFAELGKSVAELEERLTDVLSLASHWGALVLLDEGDALIERRRAGELQLNSMTGVLLRLLESFEGALFITSNRAHNIDPAALSRVTLAIHYEPLSSSGVHKIWRSTLVRILGDELIPAEAHGDRHRKRGEAAAATLVDAEFDIAKLAQFGGSGRSVGAVTRIAIALAEQRRQPLSQQTLDDAIAIWKRFHSELCEGQDHWE